MNYNREYKKIMQGCPDIYKLRYYIPVSLTYLQILACLKIYIERDKHQDGWILVTEMIEILRDCLGFRTSQKEVEYILKQEENFDDLSTISNEKINFSTFIKVVDILKREKLVLVQLGNNINYIIFGILLVLLILYIGIFYSFKKI